MKTWRRILSCLLAVTMIVTCGISGLSLSVGAEAAATTDLLFNGAGDFETDTDYSATALPSFGGDNAPIVDDPAGVNGKVVQLAPGYSTYPKWKKLYNAETGTYSGNAMKAGTSYTLKFDVYGDAIGLYFQGRYVVEEQNAEVAQGTAGWFKFGGAEEWKSYTVVFTPAEDIATTYHEDWWSWGCQFAKNGNGYGGNTGNTYLDNMSLTVTPPYVPVAYQKLDLHEFTNIANADMTVKTDEDGTEYLTIDAPNSTWAAVKTPYFPRVDRGDVIGINFKARVADGFVRACWQEQGGLTDGYTQPEFNVRASANGGDWVSYTAYITVRTTTTKKAYFTFGVHTDSTSGGTGYDIADVEFFRPEGEVNLAGLGDMENGAPQSILCYDTSGLGGATVVADPLDETNKVLYVPNGTSTYPTAAHQTWYNESNARQTATLKSNTLYRVTYRQLGATRFGEGSSTYAAVVKQFGAPGTASTEWKTITTYIQTKADVNPSYAFYFAPTADNTYIDDFTITELSGNPVTEVTLAKDGVSLAIGEEETLAYTIGEGNYESISWSSDNEAVATVDETGKVTAKANGFANVTISVKVDDYLTLTDTCAVAVVLDGDLLNGMGSFEPETLSGTANSFVTSASPRVDNPQGSGKVVEFQAGKTFFGKWGRLFNEETGSYDGALEAGKYYRITFDMLGDDFAMYFAGVSIIGRYGSDNADWTKFGATETWTKRELYIKVNEGINLDWHNEFNKAGGGGFSDTSDGSTYLDNFVVTEVEPGDEMLFNGDFEYGQTAWAKPAAATVVAEGPDGSNALKLTDSVEVWYKGVFNNMLKTNTTYIFSFDYKQEGTGDVQLFTYQSGSDWTDWTSKYLPVTSEWVHKEIIFTTGENIITNQQGYEWLVRRFNSGTGTAWFDNFSLREQLPATDVELSADALTVEQTGSATLTYTVLPSGNSYESVAFASDNEAVATVDETGKVTGIAAGTANITVTVMAGGVALTDTCVVTVVAVPQPEGDLLNGIGTFNAESYSGTPLSNLVGSSTTEIVANPDGIGNVLAIQPGHSSYGKWTNAPLESGKLYRFTFDTMGDDMALYWAGVTIYNSSDIFSGAWMKFSGSDTWKTNEIFFRVTDGFDNPDWQQAYKKNTEGSYAADIQDGVTYIDNIFIEEVTAGENLMFNGDFEYGFRAWANGVTGTSIVPEGIDGSNALKSETAVDAAAPVNSIVDVWYKNAFNSLLKPNTDYVFSFDYKNSGVGYAQLDVVTSGSDWTGWADKDLTAQEWTHVDIEFTTGADIQTNQGWEWQLRRLEWDTQPGTGYTLFDNFTLCEVLPTGVTDVTLSSDSLTLDVGSSDVLTYTLNPAEGTYESITWSSDDEAVATVDQDGNVTAIGGGEANITLTVQVDAETTLTAVCAVTVNAPVVIDAMINTEPDKLVYAIGEEFDSTGLELLVTYDNGNGEIVTEGFTVGEFDSTTAGVKTVTVTYEGFEVTFDVTVVEPITYVFGDVDEDGSINNKDLAKLIRFVNGFGNTLHEGAADVNRDGEVDNKDIGLLMQYLNGWDVTLG